MDHYCPMYPDRYYHVYNRANSNEKLFISHENYRFFMAKCAQYIPGVATLYAYALLPNHFHFLIRTHSAENIHLKENEDFSMRISKTFSNLFNSYTKSFNKFYRRRGTLFTQHCRRQLVDTFEYRYNTVLYLHRNALHHRYCRKFDDWPYSSHYRVIHDPLEKNNAELLSWFGGLDGYLDACNALDLKNNKFNFIES